MLEPAAAQKILDGGAYMAFADTLGAVGTVLNLAPGSGTTTDSSAKFFAGAGTQGLMHSLEEPCSTT